MFQLSADSGGRLSVSRLSRLLSRLLQLPGQLGEAAAFGPDRVPASVSSCLGSAGLSADDPAAALTESQLLAWLRAGPQSLVWLTVLHRAAGAETARHQARCRLCKLGPITGFRWVPGTSCPLQPAAGARQAPVQRLGGRQLSGG